MDTEKMDELVQQWIVSASPQEICERASREGVHILRFSSWIHAYMLRHNNFDLLPKLVEMLDGDEKSNLRISHLSFVAEKIIQGPQNFSLMRLLSAPQQDRLLEHLLAKHPSHITDFEKLLQRTVSQNVIFKALIPNLNTLDQISALSPYISSSFFLKNLAKVFHNVYPEGGVKLFAFWLASPNYHLNLTDKQFRDFTNMIIFLDERSTEEKDLNMFKFLKNLLDIRHDTTVLDAFIQRSTILNALPCVESRSLKNKI